MENEWDGHSINSDTNNITQNQFGRNFNHFGTQEILKNPDLKTLLKIWIAKINSCTCGKHFIWVIEVDKN